VNEYKLISFFFFFLLLIDIKLSSYLDMANKKIICTEQCKGKRGDKIHEIIYFKIPLPLCAKMKKKCNWVHLIYGHNELNIFIWWVRYWNLLMITKYYKVDRYTVLIIILQV